MKKQRSPGYQRSKEQKKNSFLDLPPDMLLELKTRGFEESKNPVYALEAFLIAREADLEIPSWTLSWLDGPFKEFYASSGKKNLNELLGFSRGQGQQGTAFKALAVAERNDILLRDIARLRSHFNMSLEEASYMVARRLEETPLAEFNRTVFKVKKDITDRTLRDLYSSEPIYEQIEKQFRKRPWTEKDKAKYLELYPPDSLPLRLSSQFRLN
jgi:hypothetical protein